MKISIKFFHLVLLVFFSTNIFAENPPPIFIQSVTLFVKEYGELESQLLTALQNRDVKVIQQLVSPNFEEINGKNPNEPLLRDNWIAKEVTHGLTSPSIRQIAVREFGNTYIVSYQLLGQQKVTASNKNLFVVDVWTKNPNSQLISRFITEVV